MPREKQRGKGRQKRSSDGAKRETGKEGDRERTCKNEHAHNMHTTTHTHKARQQPYKSHNGLISNATINVGHCSILQLTRLATAAQPLCACAARRVRLKRLPLASCFCNVCQQPLTAAVKAACSRLLGEAGAPKPSAANTACTRASCAWSEGAGDAAASPCLRSGVPQALVA